MSMIKSGLLNLLESKRIIILIKKEIIGKGNITVSLVKYSNLIQMLMVNMVYGYIVLVCGD